MYTRIQRNLNFRAHYMIEYKSIDARSVCWWSVVMRRMPRRINPIINPSVSVFGGSVPRSPPIFVNSFMEHTIQKVSCRFLSNSSRHFQRARPTTNRRTQPHIKSLDPFADLMDEVYSVYLVAAFLGGLRSARCIGPKFARVHSLMPQVDSTCSLTAQFERERDLPNRAHRCLIGEIATNRSRAVMRWHRELHLIADTRSLNVEIYKMNCKSKRIWVKNALKPWMKRNWRGRQFYTVYGISLKLDGRKTKCLFNAKFASYFMLCCALLYLSHATIVFGCHTKKNTLEADRAFQIPIRMFRRSCRSCIVPFRMDNMYDNDE